MVGKDNIDVVLTYVNQNDKIWRKQFIKEKNKRSGHINANAVDDCRFRDWGTLRYVLRSIDKYAPFVNNVFLVVQMDSQVPDWVNRDTVKVILHEEFIPEEVLPTYSSCAIEMYLHLIPGLSEKFIYFNDDMILWNPCREEDFFIGDCCVNSLKLFNEDNYYEQSEDKLYCYINKLSTSIPNEVLNKSKQQYYTTHNVSSFLKSINAELYDKITETIKKRSYQFRCKDSITQYIYIQYSILKNRCINVAGMSSLVGGLEKGTNIFKNIYYILNSSVKQICINDKQIDVDENTILSISNTMKTLDIKFQKTCKYESSFSTNG